MPSDTSQTTRPDLSKSQREALRLLSRGGARYGTRTADMQALKAHGLAVAHDTGKPPPGRWTWRPTEAGRAMLEAMQNV